MTPPSGMAGTDGMQAPFANGGADQGAMAQTAVPTDNGPQLIWKAPASWTKAPDKPMRKATYTVAVAGGTAELSVTAFPGDVGGELANLNRWRGQVKLAPVDAATAETSLQRFQVGELAVTVADYRGADGNDLLGAIIPFSGGTWFFKFTGPHAAIESLKPAFNAFLQTIQQQKEPTLGWDIPNSWLRQPEQPMRKAVYSVPTPSGAAEFSVASFPGDVGGELANINRWRGQLKMAQVDAPEAEKSLIRTQVGSVQVTVADLQGGDGNDILGAIVPFGGSTWFFKLTGSHAAVQSQKAAFSAFVASLKQT